MFNLGATLSLKDNYTGGIRRIVKEQTKFQREVIKTRNELEKTYKKEYTARVNSTKAVKEINRIIKATEPLKKEIIQNIAVREAKKNQIANIKNQLEQIHNKVFAPVIKAQDAISGFLNNLKSKILDIRTLAGAIVFGAVGKGAYNLTLGQTAGVEQNSVSLNTMLGKKGGQNAMAWSYKEAAKTPFNSNEVVDGVKRLTTYQLDYKKYLEPMGDLASSMGKPLEQAIDMLGTMASGDKGEAVMRARELGIGKKDWQKVGIQFDNQGSMMVDNPQQAIDGLMKIMKNKNLNGMMKNQSNTASGMMSNIGDNIQGMGRKVAGIKDTGEIVNGGMFDTFKNSLVGVMGTLNSFSNSPAFAKLVENINRVTQIAGAKLKGFFTYLQNNPQTIDKAFSIVGKTINAIGQAVSFVIPIVKPFFKMMIEHPKLILGAFLGLKVISGIFSGVFGAMNMLNNAKTTITNFKSTMTFVKESGALLRLGGMFTKFGGMAMGAIRTVTMFLFTNPIGIGIMLAIGAVILLYQAWKHNWGGIHEKTAYVVGAVKGFIQGMITKFNSAKSSMSAMAKTVMDKWGEIKKALAHPIKSTISVVENVTKKVFGSSSKKSSKKGSGHAYGLNRVPYNGYQATLHEGERVLTANETRQADNNKIGGNIIINVNGMTIREEADIRRVAREFVRQLREQETIFGGAY